MRNITGCPVAGLAHDELFDPTPVLEEAAAFFYGNPDYSDLPRKHKIAITACADACAAPEINCVGLVGALRDGEEGFGVLVGGGLSSVPRIARELGIWVPKAEAVQVLAAILDEWREDLRYRVSRVKARLKFMIDDIGPEGMRERIEARLDRRFDDFELPPLPRADNHLGVRDGWVGVPVHLGLLSGDQMIALAELGHEVRITRQQNLVLVGSVDAEALARTRAASRRELLAWRRDRVHRRTALQLLRHRDEVAHGRARSTAGRTVPTRLAWTVCASIWTAARTLALSTGSATSAFRGRPSATRKDGGGRHTTSTCAAASTGRRRSRDRCSAACRQRSSTKRWSPSSTGGSKGVSTARASARGATGQQTPSSPSSRGGRLP